MLKVEDTFLASGTRWPCSSAMLTMPLHSFSTEDGYKRWKKSRMYISFLLVVACVHDCRRMWDHGRLDVVHVVIALKPPVF